MRILRRHYTWTELATFRHSVLGLLGNGKKLVNFIRVKWSWHCRLEKSLGSPLHLLIEPTSECNYRCVKCARFSSTYHDDSQPGRDKYLPLDRFRQIIDDVGEQLLTLRLWHYGEPLLHPDLPEMIRYAKEKNIMVVVSSNLAPLTDEMADALVAAKLDHLIVSCDAASETSYQKCHGVTGWQRVRENMQRLLTARRRAGSPTPFVEWQFVVVKDNEAEIDQARAIAAEIGVNKMSLVRVNDTYIEPANFPEVRSLDDFLPSDPRHRLDRQTIGRGKHCRLPWQESCIRFSGAVLPCSIDLGHQFEMGRLFDGDRYVGFRTIWNNARYQEFRRLAGKGDAGPEICRTCTKLDNCTEDQIPDHERR